MILLKSLTLMNNFKTIAIFTFPAEYVVLELLLQNADIRYVFLNATMVSVLPFHSNAVGGIQLQVHRDDIIEAKHIISELENPS